MEVFFIRHAESEANAGLRTSDPSAISLTEAGRSNALQLSETLNVQPELIIATSYLRTQQTAAPFVTKYPNVPVEIWPFHEFTYLSPHACQHTTAEERIPMVKEYWKRCDPNFIHGTGAESFADFSYRISKSLIDLRKMKKENVLVFCHGLVIRMIKQLTENGEQPLHQYMPHFRDVMLKFPVPNNFVLNIKC